MRAALLLLAHGVSLGGGGHPPVGCVGWPLLGGLLLLLAWAVWRLERREGER